MKIPFIYTQLHRLFSLILCSFFILSCTAEKHVVKLDKIQTRYNNAVTLNERYSHGLYGQPDPASFARLARYRQDAYQALMQFRKEFDKTKPFPKLASENAKQKIDIYISYLNALGATSATKDTFTGF